MTQNKVIKKGWEISAQDSSTVRDYRDGKWSEPVNPQIAQLDLLSKIEENLVQIFWVGALALMVLLGIYWITLL